MRVNVGYISTNHTDSQCETWAIALSLDVETIQLQITLRDSLKAQ